jgi:phage portal protein BeeE
VGRLARTVKALASIPFPGTGWGSNAWVTGLRDSAQLNVRDMQAEVGDAADTSIVAACVNWIMRNFPEAPMAEYTRKSGNVLERQDDDRSDLVRLIARPTFDPLIGRSYYDGTLLWMATLASFTVDGNAYWLKIRNSLGEPVQLWYVPHWLIEPKWPYDGSRYLSHFEYRPSGKLVIVPIQDVVHFRFGIDPENTRKGLSPLRAEYRNIFTDEISAAFTARMIKNGGFPGVIIAPKGDEVTIDEDEAEAAKEKFIERFGGGNVGKPLILHGPSEVTQFGFDLKSMDLGSIRDIPEERVTAALNLAAAVVGFGAGLHEAHTNATMKELRASSWESNLIPTGRILSGTVKEQLAPDFVVPAKIENTVYAFDLTQVRVLQDDENKKAERWKLLVGGRIAMVSEARAAFDLKVEKEHEIFLEPTSIVPVGPGAPEEEPEPTPPTPQLDADGNPIVPALPPPTPVPALPPGPTPPKAFLEALAQLRNVALQLAADGKRDDEIASVLRAMEAHRASSDKAMLEGMGVLAKAIAERPITVAVMEAAAKGETRTVKERDEKGQIRVVEVRPLEHAGLNGDGGTE